MILKRDPPSRPDLKDIIDHPWFKDENAPPTSAEGTRAGIATLPDTQSDTGRATSPPVAEATGLASSQSTDPADQVSTGMLTGDASSKNDVAGSHGSLNHGSSPAVTSSQPVQPPCPSVENAATMDFNGASRADVVPAGLAAEKDTSRDVNPPRSMSVDSFGEYIVLFSRDMPLSTEAIDIERVVDSQLSASSYTRKPNMLRHACAEFR